MHRTVRDTAEPDAESLAYAARRRGLAIRRRRQALGLVGAAAATALVLGGTQLARDAAPPPRSDGGAAAVPQVVFESPPVRATGRTTAAALVESVTQLVKGEVTDVAGQGGGVVEGGAEHETYARLRLDPADGSGPSVVAVNVQPEEPLSTVQQCGEAELISCRSDLRPDGSVLLTYETRDGDAVRAVASLVRGDGVRVAVSSTNGFERADRTWVATRNGTLLTLDQLAAIAERPAWGLEMPASYVRAGDRLDFSDVDLDDVTGWTHGAPSAQTDPEG